MIGPVSKVYRGWERFWFEPQGTAPLALFRIALGAVATAWTVTLAPDLFDFFGPDGIVPGYPSGPPDKWGVLRISSSPPVIVGLYAVLLVSSIALLLGLHTRLAALLVFVGMLSFQRRNSLVFNSGDQLLLNLTFFCVFAPSGVALSIDRFRRMRRHFWEFPERAPWALRLMQIQLSVVYVSSVWQKVQGSQWRDGTALSAALRMEDMLRFPVPTLITDSVIISEILTYGTLGLELCIGLLVWNRALRPWLLGFGVTLHVVIDFSILVGFFSFTMLAAYVAFAHPESARRFVLNLRARLSGRRPRAAVPPPRADAGASELLGAQR